MDESRLLRVFFYSTFEPLRLRRRAPDTKRLYVITLNNFERFLERPATLDDLNDETAARFLSWFAKQPGGRSPYTANKERANLTAIWRFACRRCGADGLPLVRNWPNVEAEIEPRNDPMAWLAHEISSLFRVLRSLAGRVGSVPAGHWWTTLHLVLWDSGERIGAVMRLEWQHVDLTGRWLVVPAQVRKGGRIGKTYRLHPQTVAALRSIRPVDCRPEDKVFAWPFSMTYLWNRYGKILAKAGLPNDAKSKFHRMRRSFASHAEALGMDATELLGHSARKVTKRYLDPRIVQGQNPVDVLFRPDESASP